MSIQRTQIPTELWLKVLDEVRDFLQKKLEEHGRGACVSLHEIRGLVGEEWDEFKTCVHQNDTGHAREELLDLIVSAVWGIVSIDAQVTTDDWDSGENS
tara:strand:+ start:23494 stop:23790 length:297 start_codon:yes stop_codon:yes gene_type:complete